MALEITNLEGNEIADDYTRKSVPKGRWSDTWDVFKSNFFKFVLINIFVLITFAPGIAVMYIRGLYINGLGSVYPFNTSILYPFYPDITGMTESVTLSADILFFSMLIVAGFIASLGISGAVYSIRKLLLTHGDFSVKAFFHGIKVNYFSTLLPVTVFMAFLFLTVIVGDWMHLVTTVGGNAAAAITAYVFTIIATVLTGIFCAWLFAVGTGFRVKFTQLFKNAFVLMVGTPLQTLFMAAFTLIPIWLFMAGGIVRTISYILFIFIGFSYMLLCWTAFSQWVFDLYITPNIKAAEQQDKQKSPKESEQEKIEDDKRVARELLAAGKSELIARPIKPIGESASVKVVGRTFTRADISAAADVRTRLAAEVSDYEKAHMGDPVYAEYNKLFAEREKALQSEGGKKKNSKKISSDNLLK